MGGHCRKTGRTGNASQVRKQDFSQSHRTGAFIGTNYHLLRRHGHTCWGICGIPRWIFLQEGRNVFESNKQTGLLSKSRRFQAIQSH
eukprot:645820-Pleurochrysis_carterae.AAC.1